ncbi:hypothetical protein MMC09_003439, partial [Bachmanniomyces sp. S44760]|nr:hypothetical protein [Bachmanniomyces sp. S44760]
MQQDQQFWGMNAPNNQYNIQDAKKLGDEDKELQYLVKHKKARHEKATLSKDL